MTSCPEFFDDEEIFFPLAISTGAPVVTIVQSLVNEGLGGELNFVETVVSCIVISGGVDRGVVIGSEIETGEWQQAISLVKFLTTVWLKEGVFDVVGVVCAVVKAFRGVAKI